MIDKKKLLLADMEGTILSSSKASHQAYFESFEPMGYKMVTLSEFDKIYGAGFAEIFKFISKSDDMTNAPKVRQMFEANFLKYLDQIELYDNVLFLIALFKEENKTALVTNGTRVMVEAIFAHFKLHCYFDLILAREDVANPKPHPEGFTKAMEHFNISPKDTLILEDSPRGYQAAKASKGTVLYLGDTLP